MADDKMSKEDKAMRDKEQKRYKLQDILRMKNSVEEMILLDGDEIKKDKEVVAVLKETHKLLGGLISGDDDRLSKEDALKEVGKLRKKMNGEKDEEDTDEEDDE